jgi:hypothetical protein
MPDTKAAQSGNKKLKEGDKIPYKIGFRWHWMVIDKVTHQGQRFEGHMEAVRSTGYAKSKTAETHKEQLLNAKRIARRDNGNLRRGASSIAYTDYAMGTPAARKTDNRVE